MTLVNFPIGAVGGFSMSLEEAVDLAGRAADLINQGEYEQVRHVVNGYDRANESGFYGRQLGEVDILKTTEQLMTGFAMAYPHKVNPENVRQVLLRMRDSISISPGINLPEIRWGSSLAEKAVEFSEEAFVLDNNALYRIATLAGDQVMLDLLNDFGELSLRVMQNQLALLGADQSGDRERIKKLSEEGIELAKQWNDDIRTLRQTAEERGYYNFPSMKDHESR
jgi:hypothetical protein